jgi:transglutaminase-like putative cysteine protease
MPRSLHASLNEVVATWPWWPTTSRARPSAAPASCAPTCKYGRIDEILATGLHAFLTQFLDRVNELGGRISRDFLNVADWCDPPHLPDPSLFLRSTHMTEPHPRMSAWASALLGQPLSELAKGPTGVDQVLTLATAVGLKVGYRKGQTGVDTVALEAFDWGLGVCQDQAHVMVAVCRSIGWPARYVSGYFFDPNEPDLASHAWADVCVDAATRRWVSVDITHACLTDERHARLAVGTDYSTCPPVKGLRRGGGQETMAVDVSIFAM